MVVNGQNDVTGILIEKNNTQRLFAQLKNFVKALEVVFNVLTMLFFPLRNLYNSENAYPTNW